MITRTTKKTGRPAKGDEPAYNVEELDRLLVHGDHVELDNGQITVVYPTFRELALRYDCSLSTISDYAKAHNTARRRKAAADHLRVRSDQQLSELRAGAVALTKEDHLRILDTYIAQFEKAIAEGRVRCDSVADLNTALRLKQFMLGGADSRSEVNVTVSLEALQVRHREAVRRVQLRDARETGEDIPVGALDADNQDDSLMGGLLTAVGMEVVSKVIVPESSAS